jgi:alkyl hydroperoxide reductase subunit AhpC
MVHPNVSEHTTVRSVLVIDSDKKVWLIVTCPMSTGRDFEETLRAIDILQLTSQHPVVTPADRIPATT